MTQRPAWIAWLLPTFAGIVLVASLMGDGTGPGGQGAFSGVGWTFVFAGLGALLYWLAVHSQGPTGGRSR